MQIQLKHADGESIITGGPEYLAEEIKWFVHYDRRARITHPEYIRIEEVGSEKFQCQSRLWSVDVEGTNAAAWCAVCMLLCIDQGG